MFPDPLMREMASRCSQNLHRQKSVIPFDQVSSRIIEPQPCKTVCLDFAINFARRSPNGRYKTAKINYADPGCRAKEKVYVHIPAAGENFPLHIPGSSV